MRRRQAPARRTSRLRRALGTTAFLVVLGAIGASVIPTLLGYRVMIVTGGSMSPTIEPRDAILISKPSAATLRPGDVVTFVAMGSSRATTHRIVSLHRIGGELFLQTKGDANRSPDADLAPAKSVIGRVGPRVPGGATVVGMLTAPIGRLLLIGLPVLLLLGLEIRDFVRDGRRTPRAIVTPVTSQEDRSWTGLRKGA
jgi:signal peptidase